MLSPTARRLATFVAVLAAAGPAAAGFVVESEVNGSSANNTLAAAQNVQAAFDGVRPATVFNVAGPFSHATVSGRGGGSDVDLYSFTTLGGRAYFDIDNDLFTFDTILSLFDSAGTLIAFDDDSFGPPPLFGNDPGSASFLDSFLGVIDLTAGTYYLAVTQFSNFASTSFVGLTYTDLIRPDGGTGGVSLTGAPVGDSSFFANGPQTANSLGYTLHLSVENVAPVPAPAGLALAVVGIGSGCLARLVRRRAG